MIEKVLIWSISLWISQSCNLQIYFLISYFLNVDWCIKSKQDAENSNFVNWEYSKECSINITCTKKVLSSQHSQSVWHHFHITNGYKRQSLRWNKILYISIILSLLSVKHNFITPLRSHLNRNYFLCRTRGWLDSVSILKFCVTVIWRFYR